MATAIIAFTPTTSFALTTAQNSQTNFLSNNDSQNYRLAFAAARAQNRAEAMRLLGLIQDKSLSPFIDDILNGRSESQNTPTRRGFIRLNLPREIQDEHGPNVTIADRNALNQTIAIFRTNNDEAVLDNIEQQLHGPLAGRAAWFGGLSAYRAGYFEVARNLFQITANWQYGDENTRASGAFWAARAATKIGNEQEAQGFLEQAATYSLSFYGQMALMRLGRWNNLSIPSINDERNGTINLAQNNMRVRNAIYLNEIGQKDLAQNELFKAWNEASAQDDLGFLTIAQIMGFDDLAQRIRESSTSGNLISQFPVFEGVTPRGGSFVLDRALIYGVMRQESRFNQNAVSYAGARGLMQLMPATAAWMAGRPEFRTNPALLHDTSLNLLLGEGYLERVMAMPIIDDNIARTLMAYNAGPGNVSSWSRRIEQSEDTLFFIEATPVEQTREYVKHVLTNMWIYHKRLGQDAPTLQKLAFDHRPTYEPQDNPRDIARPVNMALEAAQFQK